MMWGKLMNVLVYFGFLSAHVRFMLVELPEMKGMFFSNTSTLTNSASVKFRFLQL